MTSKFSGFAAAMFASFALVACGGTTPQTNYEAAFNGYRDDAIDANYVDIDLEYPPAAVHPSNVPTSGTAEYSGNIALIAQSLGGSVPDKLNEANISNYGVVGDVSIEVSFSSTGGSFTGTAENFVNSSNDDVGGELTLLVESMARTPNNVSFVNERGPGISSILTGTLTGTPQGDVTLDGTMYGRFANPGEMLWGLAASEENASEGLSAFRASFFASPN